MKNIIFEEIEDDNILVFKGKLKFISIYDDNFYDRSDADIMNTSMRNYLSNRLSNLEYRWQTGSILSSSAFKTRFLFPRPQILGASPLDIIRSTKREDNDYFVFTPTQAAGFLLQNLRGQKLINSLERLINLHPVNLKKLKDHIKFDHDIDQVFTPIYNRLTNFQSDVVNSEKIKNKSHLGRVM